MSSFSANLISQSPFPIIKLTDEQHGTVVDIYAKGALLNGFYVRLANGAYKNIIDGHNSPDEMPANAPWFKSAKLSPFVCRRHKSEYEYKGQLYKTGKYFTGTEALHGLLYDADFIIESLSSNEASASASLLFTYNKKEEGFPFEYDCRVIYTLYTGNLLTIETFIKNKSADELPVTDGWHPYFSLGNTVNEWQFFMHAEYMLEYNEYLLPTGKRLADNRFTAPQLIGDTALDNCFVLKDFSSPSCTLHNPANGLTIQIENSSSYPYLQVFIPDHRKSIAVEPLSAPPDAHNNKIHLDMLQPGEEKKYSTAFRVSVNEQDK